MHVYLCLLVALTLPLTWADEEKCACQFPDQMSGSIGLWIGRLGFHYKFTKRFQVHYPLQRAKVYSHGERVQYFLDFENKTIYTYTDPSTCTSSALPEAFIFPSCVPSGLEVRYNRNRYNVPKDDLDWYRNVNNTGRYSFLTSLEGVDYEVKHGTNPCQPTKIIDAVEMNNTAARFYLMDITTYSVANAEEILFPNTTYCTEGEFPW